jgi:aspartyl-tRNA(Asn)/glutamyl-tRNA(Gln) amidotransferase subunit C
MTITREDIKNLAELARIEISESEAEKLTKEVDSILVYVGQIKDASKEMSVQSDGKKFVPKLRNVMREDVVTNKEGEYTERLLKSAPSRDGQYLKVKKIL